MIKSLFVCVALVAGVAYPVHLFLQPFDYGRSPTHRLGEFGKIDAFVQRWDYFRRTLGKVDEELAYDFGEQFEGYPKYEYEWKDLRENGYPRAITIVIDGADVVQAVVARFPSKTQDPREPELTSEELVFRLWVDLTDRTPRFKRTTAEGDHTVVHVDSFAVPGVKGTWTKHYAVPTNERSICDTVVIYRLPAGG